MDFNPGGTSVVNNAGVLFQELFSCCIQFRSNFMNLVFLLTFLAFQTYSSTLPLDCQFTITFFALHTNILCLIGLTA